MRHPQIPQVPGPAPGSSTYARHGDRHESHDISRHNTTGGRHSGASKSRVSSNDIPPRPYGEHAPVSTARSSHDGPSKGRSKMLSILVEGGSRPLEMEVTADTYVRELVFKANGILGRPSDDKAWVLCEAFGELGCGELPTLLHRGASLTEQNVKYAITNKSSLCSMAGTRRLLPTSWYSDVPIDTPKRPNV